MASLFDKLRRTLMVRVSLIYVVSAWLVLQFVELIVSRLGPFPRVAEVTAELLSLNFLIALFFAWVIEAASPNDRKYMLMRIVWAWGPMVIGFTIMYFIMFGIVGLRSVTKALGVTGLIGLIFIIWMQMTSPFARAWALRSAQNPDTLIRAEQRLNWPLTPKEVRATEIHIAPHLYYMFLAAIAALVFIIAETLLGEFFGDRLGAVGYFGAAGIAVGIAAASYPIHKRASRYVNLGSDVEAESSAKDAKSIAMEIKNALANIFKITIVRYWYITMPGLLVISYIAIWIVDNV